METVTSAPALFRFDNALRRPYRTRPVHDAGQPGPGRPVLCPSRVRCGTPLVGEEVFYNPPYGEARVRWVRRCAEAGAAGSRVAPLIPAHTDTRIWHEAMETATSLLFIKGRVKFGVPRPNGRKVAASHPSALVGWNVDLRLAGQLGTAFPLNDPATHLDNSKHPCDYWLF